MERLEDLGLFLSCVELLTVWDLGFLTCSSRAWRHRTTAPSLEATKAKRKLVVPSLVLDLRRPLGFLEVLDFSRTQELRVCWEAKTNTEPSHGLGPKEGEEKEAEVALRLLRWVRQHPGGPGAELGLRKLAVDVPLLDRCPQLLDPLLVLARRAPRLEELRTGLLGTAARQLLLPLPPQLQSLKLLGVEANSPEAYLDLWRAVSRTSVRSLGLWTFGRHKMQRFPRLDSRALASLRGLVASLPLVELSLKVHLLQESLASLPWPATLRKLAVLGADFDGGAADGCCSGFAQQVCASGISVLHIDCWHGRRGRGLSQEGLRRLMEGLAPASLEVLEITWRRLTRPEYWECLRPLLLKAKRLREVVVDAPLDEDVHTDRGLRDLQDVAARRGIRASWTGLTQFQELEVHIVIP